jgi:membrane protease YdiL (CAAX protease family)
MSPPLASDLSPGRARRQAIALLVLFWEETVFRGFLLGRLRASIPVAGPRGAPCRRDALAVVVAALCFGAGHGYQGVLGIVQTTSAGLVLGTLAVWRQSLWPCIGAHLAIDAFGLVALKALRP